MVACRPRRSRARRARRRSGRPRSSRARAGTTPRRAALMPMRRTERLGLTSPGRPGWKRPTTPRFFSPVRSSRMFVLLVLRSASLSDGMSGRPRQVRNGEPNSVTVGGGTPRRVHSRPNAAMARGCARKNAGSFQTLAMSSSRSSGVGAPVARRDLHRRGDAVEQAVVRVVDELALLALLHHLDRARRAARGPDPSGCGRGPRSASGPRSSS